MDTKLMNIAAKNTNYSIQVGWLMVLDYKIDCDFELCMVNHFQF
jgi:hypothetical protein